MTSLTIYQSLHTSLLFLFAFLCMQLLKCSYLLFHMFFGYLSGRARILSTTVLPTGQKFEQLMAKVDGDAIVSWWFKHIETSDIQRRE